MSSYRTTWSENRSQPSSRSSNSRSDLLSMSRKKPPVPLLPVFVSQGSSSQDVERSKTTDVRYYHTSFLESRQHQQKLLSWMPKDRDERYYPGSYQWSSDQRRQSNEQSIPGHQVSSSSGNPCDTNNQIPPCASEGDPSIEGSTESEDSGDHCSVSSSNYDQLSIAYAKHQMMVSLMQEVYAMFNFQWQANIRTRTRPKSRNSRSQLEASKSSNSSKENCSRNRVKHNREPSPDDSNNGKRRRSNPTDARESEPDQPFACPFHKYDPCKYCPNLDTGTKYRPCSGPGFSSISKLK